MPLNGYLYSLRKIGGLWFLRIGRWQMSFCRCRDGQTTVAGYWPKAGAIVLPFACGAARGLDL